jgi:hypothetical protein
MNLPTDIPVTVTPEAAARIAELGMQAEFEQMLANTLRTVPDLVRIKVEREEPYDTGGEPAIGIWTYTDRPYAPEDRSWRDWDEWAIRTFPPRVLEHFSLLPVYLPSHAR